MNDVRAQYDAVRNDWGLVDRSDQGRLLIRGADRFSWLQGMVSNDVKPLQNKAYYVPTRACVLDPTGHILTDLTLTPVRKRGQGNNRLAEALGMGDTEFLIADMARENVEKITRIFDRYIISEDVEIADVSDRIGCIAVQGPTAYRVWDVEAPEFAARVFHSLLPNAMTYPSNHYGSDGFDLFFPMEKRQDVLTALRDGGVMEVGPSAAEILRIEAGIPKYGVDMDETTLAPEAGISTTHISLTKGCYVGQEIVARIDSRGHTNRALTGLLVMGETLPVGGEKLFVDDVSGDGKETGRITSVAPFAPAVGGRPIALGYVRHEHRSPGAWLRLGNPDSGRMVEIAELPFYTNRNPAS